MELVPKLVKLKHRERMRIYCHNNLSFAKISTKSFSIRILFSFWSRHITFPIDRTSAALPYLYSFSVHYTDTYNCPSFRFYQIRAPGRNFFCQTVSIYVLYTCGFQCRNQSRKVEKRIFFLFLSCCLTLEFIPLGIYVCIY